MQQITEHPVKNDFNAMIGLGYFDHNDRIKKTKYLEREMTQKRKLTKRDFRITTKDDNGVIYCEFWDKNIFY